MQLQHVRFERLDDAGQCLVAGTDSERDLAGAAFDALAKRPRSLQSEIARAGGKEHEADQIRARFKRHIKRLRGR